MTTPVNFRVKNGLTVANGITVSAGNLEITSGQLVIGATAINSSSLSTSAETAYANSLIYADGRAADAYANANLYTDNKAGNAYSNAVTFAANASNLSTGTLSVNRLPATVNVSLALNVANTVAVQVGNVTITNGNDFGTFTASRISFTDNVTETGNTFYVAVTHNELITSKTYSIANVVYSDYGQMSRSGMFAVVGLDTTNNAIYVRGVTVNTSVISIGNNSAYSLINSTAIVGNGALLTSINAATLGGNSASDLRTYTETYASNATNLTSGTVNSARLPAANSTVAGAVVLVDSVSNTSTTAAAAAASVKSAYDTAITANTNATNLSANAYSNAVTYAASIAGTAYANAVTYASNASNISTGTLAFARLPSVDAVNNTSITLVPVANNVKTAYDAAISANTRAASAQTAAESAYTNATAFSANATNISSGTVAFARLPSVDAVNNTSITLVPVANNVKTAYDAAIAANTRAASAQTAATSAYTNAIAIAANATNLTSGTVNSARLPSGNSTVAGAVVLVDSVSNTSTTAAASAASVKAAYDAAITANTNAQTALTAAGTAYTNAVSYTDTKIGTANAAITGNSATAYTNAVSYTDTKIGTANTAMVANASAAYTNAIAIAANATNLTSGTVAFARLPSVDAVNNTSITLVPVANNVKTAYDAAITANTNAQTALTAAGSAYSNAVTYTDTKIATANSAITGNAATAYTNAVSYTDTKIGTANAAITGNAATAYTNAVSYTDSKILTANAAITGNAATAYTNAVSYTDSKIGTANTAMVANASAAYTNATIFAANASNANNGTLAEARLPYRMNQDLRTSDSPTFANGSFTGSVTVGGSLTVTGNLISTNIESFSVSDPLIKLGVNNPGDTYWGGFTFHYNGSGNTTNHAGLIRSPTTKEFILMSTFGDETAVANNNTINIADASFSYANLTVNLLKAGNATVFSTINATSFSGTANNADYLDGQHGSYYTNATNITTGTLPYAQIPANVINTTATFTRTGITTFSANIVLGSSGLSANGGFGTAGHVLHSNGTATYWAADDQGVTSVATGNGMTGGTITTTGTVSILANTGIVANSTGAFVNSAYIATITSNAATFSNTIIVADTRNTNTTPETTSSPQVRFDFKANATDNLSDGGLYFGEMSFRPYGSGTDWSGGPAHQLGFTSNNNLYHRSGNSTTWGSWGRLYKEGTVLAAGNTTITGFANVSSELSVNSTFVANSTAVYATKIVDKDNNSYWLDSNGNSYFSNVYTQGWLNVTGVADFSDVVTVYAALNVTSTNQANLGILRVRSTSNFEANVAMANNYIVRPALAGYTEHEVANTAATGTWTMDCSAANFFDLTLTGSITISPTNVPPSTRMWAGTIAAKQDATGGRTITWPTGTKWPGGVAPPATTTANAIDIWSLMTYDGGSTWIASLTVKGAA